MTETITWLPPTPRPRHAVVVLLSPRTGNVATGYWDRDDKCWILGMDDAIDPAEGDVVAWAKMPRGAKRK